MESKLLVSKDQPIMEGEKYADRKNIRCTE
jgi:hypothetical protein